jgi:hypothetical protein
MGTVLVAGSNGMTVYVFANDVKDSGTSNCTGGCLDTWPALTVPAGGTPVAGATVAAAWLPAQPAAAKAATRIAAMIRGLERIRSTSPCPR